MSAEFLLLYPRLSALSARKLLEFFEQAPTTASNKRRETLPVSRRI